MLGTAPGMPSGIASLVEVYRAHGLFDRWNVEYVETHREGDHGAKVAVAFHAWIRAMGRVLTGRVALLHIHLASYASFWRKTLFALPARAFGVPYVLHVHGGHFADFYRAQGDFARRVIRFVLRHAERVVALSPEWRGTLESIEPASRITIVPNPVTVPAWHAPLDEAPPTALFLGVLVARKGLLDLLNAWVAVRDAIPDARLVIAGSGDIARTTELAREIGVADSVRITGWVEGDAKQALLRRAWVLALPSHAEALPMAVLEALAAGIPVVATRVGGIPAAVEEGRNGLLVPPRDRGALAGALIRVLSDAQLRKGMGAAARERAMAEFSADVAVPSLEAIWRDIAPHQEASPRPFAA
jgi:glycosyltransferase involved in cell wall biosynthesis